MYFENQDYSHCYLDEFTIKELITALSLYAEKYPTACIRGIQEADCAPYKIYGLVQYKEECAVDEYMLRGFKHTAIFRTGRSRPSRYVRQWDLPQSNNLSIADFIQFLKSLPPQLPHVGIIGGCWGDQVLWIQGFWKTPRTDHIYLSIY